MSSLHLSFWTICRYGRPPCRLRPRQEDDNITGVVDVKVFRAKVDPPDTPCDRREAPQAHHLSTRAERMLPYLGIESVIIVCS